MKGMKFSVGVLCAALLMSGCSMSNTAKGSLIGGGGGAALGALVGSFIGKGKGAAIGAAIGTAVGAGAGAIIGNKMDKAKKAAEAANAQAEILTDENGNPVGVQATFPSGLLFATGKSTLSADAKSNIAQFAANIDADLNLQVYGYTDNAPFKGKTAAQSKQLNVDLSYDRANAVKTCLLNSGVASSRIEVVKGYGEEHPIADNSTAAGKAQNRRVEVYVVLTEAAVKAANAAAAAQ